ncbi:hypothetical protein [Dyella silvatica]|uniref:hypothetical protein n=1 Tax=Dyella silvatica TaxID=2992128 RepID=UPI00225A3679|nr:hypothetical protein [Dyella silvatica]
MCHAQTSSVTPENEYKKLIKVNQDIQPLGDSPFGESVGLYDGSLTFNQTDISMPGAGPLLQLSRSLKATGEDAYPLGAEGAFADWEVDIPRIETNSANQANVTGWITASNNLQRCTYFEPPPPVTSSQPGGDPWGPNQWWYGYHLIVPGQGSQDLLARGSINTLSPQISGMSFPIITTHHWMISCGVTADDGGEGFLALAPDGTQYTFSHLLYRPMATLTSALGTGPMVAARGVRPMLAPFNILYRRDASMLVTKVQDRFGNTLTYSYDPSSGYLTGITASDGRQITLQYGSGTTLVSSVTLQSSTAAPRTWTYQYGTFNGEGHPPTLTGVQLPDGSAWSYSLGAFQQPQIITDGSDCKAGNIATLYTVPVSGSITHPSGLTATFNLLAMMHGRSYVPKQCYGSLATGTSAPYAVMPQLYAQLSLTSKVFTGAGLPTETWAYSYSSPNQSWTTDACASNNSCASSVYTDVLDPLGNDVRYTFSNRFDVSEGQMLRTDYYAGAAGGTIIRSVSNSYANPTAGPWPTSLGVDQQIGDNRAQVTELSPLQQRTISQDGDTYTWQASTFDEYAQATQITRSNSIAGQSAITEKTTFLNDLPHWVLGLPQEVDNLTTGETESLNTYNLSNVTLQSRARFGQTLMSYTFDGQGQLASFTDGRSNTTTLSNYKRGIPQAIGYADKTTQSLVVDDFGQIGSITDQAGNTTSYSYDAVGRVTGVTYPTGDEVSWYPTTLAYNFIPNAERGIAANHWRRTTTLGNAITTTYFDAMLRPVLSDTAISGTANSDISARTDYDWKGQKTFVSYPVSGAPDLSAISSGTSSIYDALGRLTQTQQASELGTLTATTAYLSGARQQITDPKGYVTTTSYQVFDQPSYSAVIQVQAPEGITQAITRDLYGNPTVIHQWGSTASGSGDVSKTLTYDSYHRLCQTTEPESGSEVTAYDGANNVAWTASGLSISGTGCGQEQVADAAKTTFGYDTLNRVLTLSPPSGTQSTVYTYDLLGNTATATSGISTWSAQRNKRAQLTSETLSVTGNGGNVLRYGHDSYGNLLTISYPDSTIINYAPDALGRPTQAGSYATGASYFPDGSLQSFTFGNGTNYIAEQNTRLLLSNFSYGKGSTLNLSEDYGYDANGNISGITDLTTGGTRTKTFGYDTLNRLTQAQATNLWGTESYQYDPLNNLRSRTSSGQTFTYNYDATNRLASITNGATTTSSFLYDNRGNITTKNGNTLVFDAKNQLLQIPGFDSYAYDASGRRVLKTPASGNSSTYYFYNQAGQLLYQFDGGTTKTTDYIYLGKKMIARNEGYATSVLGGIDGINVGVLGNGFVSGWACSSGLTQSINVDLYVGGPLGTGTLIGRYSANQASEAGVLSACGVTTGSYRFYIALSNATQSQYAGKGVYVYGISPVGNSNALLTNSGVYVVPAAPSTPVAPTSTSATVASDLSSISVSWTASTGATSYIVQQQVNGGAWTALVNGNTTSTTISNPADGSYVFQAQACNANGCSVWTASSAVKVAHIPPTPASISVPATSNGPIAISWAASATATRYDLYQSFNGGTWAQVYSGPATSTTITATASGNYNYFVSANNANGWSGQLASSSTVVVTIPPASAPSLTVPASSNTGSYSVSWGSVSGAASYTLQEQVNGGGWSTVQASNANSWSTSGRGNGTYGYQVQACNAGGCGPWSAASAVSVLLTPPVPTGFQTLSSNPRKGSVTVGWNAVGGATSYTVQVTAPSGGVTLNTVTATSYSTIWLQTSGVATFRVNACNANGCSAWSGPLTDPISSI